MICLGGGSDFVDIVSQRVNPRTLRKRKMKTRRMLWQKMMTMMTTAGMMM